MKKVIIYFMLGITVMLVSTYINGLFDDAFYKTGIWYKDLINSFKYYALWILPYWWTIILTGSIIMGVVFHIIHICIIKIKHWK